MKDVLRLYHIDLYRLDEGVAAAHAVDLDELLADETSVIAIEWAERMTNYPLPSNAWQIVVTGDGDDPTHDKDGTCETIAPMTNRNIMIEGENSYALPGNDD